MLLAGFFLALVTLYGYFFIYVNFSQIFDDNGRFVKQIEIKFVDIVAGLTTTPDGKIVVMDSVRPTVFIIDPDNRVPIKYLDIADTVSEPSDIVVYNDHFYICDFKVLFFLLLKRSYRTK